MWWKSKKPAEKPEEPQSHEQGQSTEEHQAPAQRSFRPPPRSQTGGGPQPQPQPQAAPEAQPGATPEPTPEDHAPAIRKGVYLSALVYVEGDQAAPDDFNALAISILKQVLGDALKGKPQGLDMTLKSVDVQNDVEEDDGGGGGQASKGGAFQF